jgi:hypothetical protein
MSGRGLHLIESKKGVTFGRQRVFAEFYDTSIRSGAANWTWRADWTGAWPTACPSDWPRAWSTACPSDWPGASKCPATRARTGTASRSAQVAQAEAEADEAWPGSSKGSEEKTAAKIIGASKFREPTLQ